MVKLYCNVKCNINLKMKSQNLKVVLNESLVLGMTSVVVYLRTHTTTFGNSDDSDNDSD